MKRRDPFESRYQWIYKKREGNKKMEEGGSWHLLDRAVMNPLFKNEEMGKNTRKTNVNLTTNECKVELLQRPDLVLHLHTKTNS